MKRFIPLSIAALMIFSSCASSGGEQNAQAATSSASETSESAEGGEGAAAAEGEAPADVKTVYGEVSEVIGNAIVIKEIEMPQRMNFGGEGMNAEDIPVGEDGQPDFSQMELPEGVTLGEDGTPDFSQMEMPEGMTEGGFSGGGMPEGFTPGEMPEGFTAGEMPEGFTPGEGMTGNGAAGEEAGGMAREPNYTGEEIEVIIPVGIPVMTRTRGDEGMVESEIDLDEISAGDTITVTYKEDGKTVSTVYVTQAGTAGGFGGGRTGDGGDFFFGGGMPPEMPGN